jgi:hypothetical protein
MAAIKLLSGINNSGLYAQYASSAEKDKLGRDITATYLTAVPSNYPTNSEVGSAIGDAIADLSGTIDASAFATQTYVDTEIGKIGAYVTANSAAGGSGEPDVDDPNTKTIYLVKDTSAPGTDKWKEWIVTATSPVGWELIGDTSMSLNGYATETWVGDNYVSKTSTAGWDVTPYTGDNGIEVSNNVISISANYLSANALDAIAAASGNWNSAAQAVETSSTTWNSVTAKQDTLTFSYATVGE